MVHNFYLVTKFTTKELLNSIATEQEVLQKARVLYRSTPELQLCYGTVLVMLLFYSLVTNQATTYKKVQTKVSVHFALWTTLVMLSYVTFVMTSKEKLNDLNAFSIHC